MSVVIGRYKKTEKANENKEVQSKLEYALYTKDNPLGRPEGEIILFSSKNSAMDSLRDSGIKDENMDQFVFIKINTIVCPKCGHKVSIQEDESASCICGFHTDKVNLYELEIDINGEVI